MMDGLKTYILMILLKKRVNIWVKFKAIVETKKFLTLMTSTLMTLTLANLFFVFEMSIDNNIKI